MNDVASHPPAPARTVHASGQRGTQDLADHAAAWLTFIALAAGALTLGVWLLLRHTFAF